VQSAATWSKTPSTRSPTPTAVACRPSSGTKSAEWLAKLNQRRHASITQEGRAAPQPYKSLEPRAVLSCLADDSAGLQLISAAAVKGAKQPSLLANEAVHANPQAPLTETDGYRQWQLYTDITGRVPDVDPFER